MVQIKTKNDHCITMKEGTVEIINLDVHMAHTLLSLRPKATSKLAQRRVSQKHVDEIARAIKAERFVWLGDPLRLNKNSELIDGQHRCLAVVKAGITLPNQLLVTTNTEDAIMYIDTTTKLRSPNDIRAITRRKRLVTAVESAILMVESDFQKGRGKLTTTEKVLLTDRCPELDDLHSLFNRSKNSGVRLTAGFLAAALLCMRVDYPQAMIFFGALADNKPFQPEDGTHIRQVELLVRWLLRCKTKEGLTSGENFKYESADKAVMAWNAWREGREISKLQPSKQGTVATPI